jgi:hypothetical protein
MRSDHCEDWNSLANDHAFFPVSARVNQPLRSLKPDQTIESDCGSDYAPHEWLLWYVVWRAFGGLGWRLLENSFTLPRSVRVVGILRLRRTVRCARRSAPLRMTGAPNLRRGLSRFRLGGVSD